MGNVPRGGELFGDFRSFSWPIVNKLTGLPVPSAFVETLLDSWEFPAHRAPRIILDVGLTGGTERNEIAIMIRPHRNHLGLWEVAYKAAAAAIFG